MPQTRGRPPKYAKVEELGKKIDDYFNWCETQLREYTDLKGNVHIIYKPYTVSGLCLYLDITRDTLCEYEKLDKFSDTVKKAKHRIENWIEEHSLSGELNPAVSIFNLKNNFGWKDKTETDMNVQGDIRNTHYGRVGVVNEIKLDDKTIELYKELHRREKNIGIQGDSEA